MVSFIEFVELLSKVIICLTGGLAFWQLLLMKQNFKDDHDRIKRQSTIEYYTKFYHEYEELFNKIIDKFPANCVIETCDSKYDKETEKEVIKYLDRMEFLAVSINTEIFDIDEYNKLAGHFTINQYKMFEKIIINQRNIGNPIAYYDFEKLVYNLGKRRDKISSKGKPA